MFGSTLCKLMEHPRTGAADVPVFFFSHPDFDNDGF